MRKIRGPLDLSRVYAALAAYYSEIGRPSIDPVLMIRMLIIGYVFAIRSEKGLACRFTTHPSTVSQFRRVGKVGELEGARLLADLVT